MDEAQLVELPNGDVMANMRNNHANATCACRGISVSQDGGVTWGPISYDSQLPEPVCMASIIRSNDAYYFSNPGTIHGRVNGTVLQSLDGARTWSKLIEVNPGGNFGYSCLSETSDDGTLGLLWETNADGCAANDASCRVVFSPIPVPGK
jgi:sialidase-1